MRYTNNLTGTNYRAGQPDAGNALKQAAEHYKVDIVAITAKVKQEFAAKEKAKVAQKATAKPQAKAAKKSNAA